EERDAPADEDAREQPESLAPTQVPEAQAAVPGEGHEGVGEDQERDGPQGFHGGGFAGAKLQRPRGAAGKARGRTLNRVVLIDAACATGRRQAPQAPCGWRCSTVRWWSA